MPRQYVVIAVLDEIQRIYKGSKKGGGELEY